MAKSTPVVTRNLMAFKFDKTEFHLHHTQIIASQNTHCVSIINTRAL